jgi:hypothetical protein
VLPPLLVYDEGSQCFSLRPALRGKTTSRYFTARQLARNNFIGGFSSCVYRRGAVERLDPALYDMTVYDWMFNIVVARQGVIGYIPEIMSVYREHAAGAWSGMTREKQSETLSPLIDQYNEYLDLAFDAEFQAFKRVFQGGIRNGSPRPRWARAVIGAACRRATR